MLTIAIQLLCVEVLLTERCLNTDGDISIGKKYAVGEKGGCVTCEKISLFFLGCGISVNCKTCLIET